MVQYRTWISRYICINYRFTSVQHEDIRFNPELMQFCQKDIKTICHDIKPGQARMVQCLRSHRNKLTTQCRSHLFGVEVWSSSVACYLAFDGNIWFLCSQEEETKNRKLDFMLMRTCKPAIKELCQMHMNSGDVGLILDCLVTHKNLLDSGWVSEAMKCTRGYWMDIEIQLDCFSY